MHTISGQYVPNLLISSNFKLPHYSESKIASLIALF
jgi:hypothetical protein